MQYLIQFCDLCFDLLRNRLQTHGSPSFRWMRTERIAQPLSVLAARDGAIDVPFTLSASSYAAVDPTMRVAIYARVSTKDQSCDLQVRDLNAYCAARKFTIFREYIDVGESGAKNSRPELNNLMAV